MTKEQAHLINQAKESLEAARILNSCGYHGFAASRAYYSMFYIAEAFLLGKQMVFSSHAAVIAAFGKELAKTGEVPTEFHRFLIRGMEVRHTGDYDSNKGVTSEETEEQLKRAEQFLELAEKLGG
ncbi:MAG: HEPN domain-containing protein [Desulfuromonadales bacterium]